MLFAKLTHPPKSTDFQKGGGDVAGLRDAIYYFIMVENYEL